MPVLSLLQLGQLKVLSLSQGDHNERENKSRHPPSYMRWPHKLTGQVHGLGLREIGGGFTRHHRAPSVRAACYAIAKPSTMVQKMQNIKSVRGHRNAVYCGKSSFKFFHFSCYCCSNFCTTMCFFIRFFHFSICTYWPFKFLYTYARNILWTGHIYPSQSSYSMQPYMIGLGDMWLLGQSFFIFHFIAVAIFNALSVFFFVFLSDSFIFPSVLIDLLSFCIHKHAI